MCVMCWMAIPVAGATPDDEKLRELEREVAELRAAVEELRTLGLAEDRLRIPALAVQV